MSLPKDEAVMHKNRGYEYIQKGDFDNAIAEYTLAKNLDKCDATVCNTLGKMYFFEKRETIKAIEAYREAIRRDPNYAEAYYNLAWI